jgi:hypothetical protein
MDSQKHVGISPDLGDSAIRNRVFMARVVPVIAISGVDLLILKLDTAAPVEHIPKACCSLDPDPLYLFTPTWLKDLIKVQRDTNINVARDKSKSGITSKVKAPRLNTYLMYLCAANAGQVNSPVRAACVCDEDEVCIFG